MEDERLAHRIEISKEYEGGPKFTLTVLSRRLSDGTFSVVYEPRNIQLSDLEVALRGVVPTVYSPLPLRTLWLWTNSFLRFPKAMSRAIDELPWHTAHSLEGGEELEKVAKFVPERVEIPTPLETLPAPGNLSVLYDADFRAWGIVDNPTLKLPNPVAFGAFPSLAGLDRDGTLGAMADLTRHDYFLVDAGGSGECFFCALASQLDVLGAFKWFQYIDEYGVKITPTNRELVLRALGTFGFLDMLRHPREFALFNIYSFTGDDNSPLLQTFQFGRLDEHPDDLFREYAAACIAPTSANLAAFKADIKNNVVDLAKYRAWIAKPAIVRPYDDNAAEDFCRTKQVSKSDAFKRQAKMLHELVAQNLEYLRKPYSHVTVPHMLAIVRALRISLFITLFDKGLPRDEYQVNTLLDSGDADFTVRLVLLNSRAGTGPVSERSGHYVAEYPMDEFVTKVGQTFPIRRGEKVTFDAFKALFQRFIEGPPESIGTSVDQWPFERNGLTATRYRARLLRYGPPRGYSYRLKRARRVLFESLVQPEQSVEGLLGVLFECATYSYYQTKGPAAMFGRAFASIMTATIGDVRAPIDQVRFFHRLFRTLLEQQKVSVSATGTDPLAPSSVYAVLPITGIDLPQGKFWCSNTARGKAVAALADAVARIVLGAVVAAMNATLYYFCVPPSGGIAAHGNPHDVEGADYLYDEDVNRILSRVYGAPERTTTKSPDKFIDLARRARMFGFQMTEDMEREVYLFARTYLLRRPRVAATAPTAFHEHARILMQALYLRTGSTESLVVNGRDVSVPIETVIRPPPVMARLERSAPVDMKFATKGPEDTHFLVHLDIRESFPSEFTRKYHTDSRLVAWLTRAPTLEVAAYDTSSHDSFERYLRHVEMGFAVLDGRSSATIDLRLRRSDVAAAQAAGRIFLHVAHMALETNPDVPTQRLWVRSGHGFVDLASFERTGQPLALPLWEGPTDSRFAWDANADYAVKKSMEFKKTHVMSVSIDDNGRGDLLVRSNVTAPPPPGDKPNTIYTRAESAALVRYVASVVGRLPPGTTSKHSLLYLNFPIGDVLVPNWASLLLPPVGVNVATLEARVAGKLHDEGLTVGEFEKIAMLASSSYSVLSRYARDRFVWIVTQIINPFNKVCYRFDRVDGVANDQMQFPLWGSGDCEDTAEGVVRFIRGLKAIAIADVTSAAARLVLTFLQDYEPAMTVMTTVGAKLSHTAGPTGLHMMAVLVPHGPLPGTLPIVPVETTGLTFNSYVTPDALLAGAPAAERQPIIAATRAYNRVCKAAERVSTAVRDETINYAVLIDAEGGESRFRGDEFARRHHFYREFVMLMRASQPGFADFRKDAALGVPFAEVIFNERTGWHVDRVDRPEDIRAVAPLVQRYADNVMPAPDLSGTSTADELPTVPHESLPRDHGDSVLAVRSVNFFIPTAATSEARRLMDELADALRRAALPEVARIEPVDTVTVLGGAIEYLILRVRLRPNLK